MANAINPNLLLLAGVGVAAYLVWRQYDEKRPKGGSGGAPGGVVGAIGGALVGGAPVASNDGVSNLPEYGFDPYTGIRIDLRDPAEGGTAEHTPFRNSFALRLMIENHGNDEVNDVLQVIANVDARYVPSGVSTFTTTYGPFQVGARQVRYVQVPVDFGDWLSVGPFGWDVSIDVSYGGGGAQRSFIVK